MNEVKFKANIKDLKAVQAEVEAIPAIPVPTVEDEGKVVTVTVDNSGETPVAEYGLAEGGGGGGLPFRVDYTYDENENGYTCNKTLAQIFAAWNAGNFIYAVIDDIDVLLPAVVSEPDEEVKYSRFQYGGISTLSLIDANSYTLQHLMDNDVETITTLYAAGKISVSGWTES